jgi:hypothetical protein
MPIEIQYSYFSKQNMLNPFNPLITIKYEIPAKSFVTLVVYDSLGNEVTSLINEIQDPGKHEVEWNSFNNTSGVYFYKLLAGEYRQTKRMVLIK